MEEESCGRESQWGIHKCVVWLDDPEGQLIGRALLGRQEAPSIGPKVTTKHPSWPLPSGGEANFLKVSSNYEFPLLFHGAVILFHILRILNPPLLQESQLCEIPSVAQNFFLFLLCHFFSLCNLIMITLECFLLPKLSFWISSLILSRNLISHYVSRSMEQHSSGSFLCPPQEISLCL